MRIIGLFFVICAIVSPLPAFGAGETKDIRKITVSGRAENTVDAQRAEISLSVRIVSKEMSRSHAALTSELSRLAAELKSIGIAEKDIKRSLVLQGAEYNWEKQSRVLKGYYAECSVDVIVNDIAKMADLYRTLAGHRSVTIGSTEFKRNDEFELRKAEYEKALAAAKKKAEFMAQALGARAGRVYSIVEESGETFGFQGFAANVEKREAGGQASYGTIRVVAKVMVEFELE